MKANEMTNRVELSNASIKAVLAAISAESKTLGGIIRNFKAVCETNETALYMLQCICNDFEPNLLLRVTTNEIRSAVIAAYPYKDNGIMLHKVNGIFVPFAEYTPQIIKAAYYNAVGATKKVEFAPATEEQIAEAEEKAAAKKAEKAEKKAAEKANAEALQEFVTQILAAESPEVAWTLIQTYKKQAEENQASAE